MRPRRGSFGLPAFSLVALAALAACDTAGPAPSPPADLSDDVAAVGPGVAEAIRSGDGARVMIALHPPAVIRSRQARSMGPVEPGPYIAALRQQVGQLTDAVLARAGTDGLDELRRFQTVPALAATLRSEEALARWASDPAVRRIDLDVGGTGGLENSIPQIGADRRHRAGNEGSGVLLGVMDTGIDTDHPSLVGRLVHQACFGQGPSGGFCPDGSNAQIGAGAAEDDAGHGTHVTGIAASGGQAGGVGVAPAASIVAIKVMDDCSFSGCFYSFADLVTAWDHVATNFENVPVRVLNMSLGTGALFGGVCDNATSWTMAGSDAVNTLWDLGVVIFASSMNNGSSSSMAAPACFEKVVSVAAHDASNALADFSNGNAVTDLAAPGVNIFSLAVGGGLRRASGTSMASPHAMGCAALLIEEHPAWTADEIVTFLRDTPRLVDDPRNGFDYPRLDCSPNVEQPDPQDVTTVTRPGS